MSRKRTLTIVGLLLVAWLLGSGPVNLGLFSSTSSAYEVHVTTPPERADQLHALEAEARALSRGQLESRAQIISEQFHGNWFLPYYKKFSGRIAVGLSGPDTHVRITLPGRTLSLGAEDLALATYEVQVEVVGSASPEVALERARQAALEHFRSTWVAGR